MKFKFQCPQIKFCWDTATPLTSILPFTAYRLLPTEMSSDKDLMACKNNLQKNLPTSALTHYGKQSVHLTLRYWKSQT